LGDIFFALREGYEPSPVLRNELNEFEDPHHMDIHGTNLPNICHGNGSLEATIRMAGEKVKRNYRRAKPLRLVDFAPMIAYALGIRPPRQC
jgi:hypothetical protein